MGWLDNWKRVDSADLEVPTGMTDLSTTVVVFDSFNPRLQTYCDIIKEEVFKRTKLEWRSRDANQASLEEGHVLKLVVDETLEESLGKEGYAIEASQEASVATVTIQGATDRAVLFGVGRFLREMKFDYHISYAKTIQSLCCCNLSALCIRSKPKYRMRQHQIAYRPKTNSYDAFSVQMMKQEVLDLALFGTNGVEMIPPGVDDAMQSPNFQVPWLEMLGHVSGWCDSLGINVSMWYPAFFKTYDEPEMLQQAKAHWELIFSSLKRLDVLFVPGGDPGGRPAEEFFRVVEMQASFLRDHFFPNCEVWVSSQYGLSASVDLGLTEPWVPMVQEQQWFNELKTERVQSFINGAVYGPWSAIPISEFRMQLPKQLPLRNYPDLCHVQTAEMPVFGWDLSFALTNARESINPRPREMLNVIETQAPNTIGCGCYSEGVNDDLNKYVWTSLHWGDDIVGPLAGASSEQQLHAMLSQYVSFLMDQPRNVGAIVEGILGLEQNWKGDLLSSTSILTTSRLFTEVQERLSPRHRKNWRLNLILFRAMHDLLIYTRLCQERIVGSRAVDVLLQSRENISLALEKLKVPYSEPAMTTSSFTSRSTPDALNITKLSSAASVTHLYGQLMALAAVLYHQIGYQLSVGYGGQHRQRGAYFDLVWAPLGDVGYINKVLKLLQQRVSQPHAVISPREEAIVERFVVSLDEMLGNSVNKVVWYASFGDEQANEVPGSVAAPTQPIPACQVVPPFRAVELGEDPVFFTRPLVEFLDCSNDGLIRDLHDGLIPRAWRSFIEPIWPRTSKMSLQFSLSKLTEEPILPTDQYAVRITYLGNDLNKHGGDWEELDRESMPTRLDANGVMLHDFVDPPKYTRMKEYVIPPKALERAIEMDRLILTFTPQVVDKTTFRYVPIPLAELWILKKEINSKL
mmetsp:Transcript_27238/g.43788  ORF Transcript_27238/g.43788 Transcript_27238/m.43788 type:complete len:915 (+) Transcript_27238:197-2941(+)